MKGCVAIIKSDCGMWRDDLKKRQISLFIAGQ
jgi:hypothetical protein